MIDAMRNPLMGKAARVALALVLVVSSAIAVPAQAHAAAKPAYESGINTTFSEKLGFDPDKFVENLEKHKDRYLGTPYSMDNREAGPGSGMDCSTFVSYALINEAGVADSTLRYDMTPRYGDDNCLPNTETLFNWAYKNSAVKVYSSKSDLLASSPKKGDILFVWAKSAGRVPVGGADSHVGIYWGEEDGEDLMFHSIPSKNKIGPIEGKVVGDLYYAKVEIPHGYTLTVSKTASDKVKLETTTNSNYAKSLEGAEYGVFSDEGCTKKVSTITIKKDGSKFTGTSEELDEGTYWVKETKAPAGYALDSKVTKVVLDKDSSMKSSEDKQYATLDIMLTKVARDGDPVPEGDGDFSGAQFEISYPNGKKGIYQTDKDGKVSMKASDGALVSGDAMDVHDGMYVLQLGTYTVTEVKAPTGCVIPADASRTFNVSAKDQTSATSTKITFENEYDGSFGYVQTPVLGGVMVAKGDSLKYDKEATGNDGSYFDYAQGDATLAGAEFTVYNESANRVDVDLNGNGKIDGGEAFAKGDAILTIASEYDADLDAYVARTSDRLLPYGTYKVVETKAPEGYTAQGATEKAFEVREDGHMAEFLLADGELNEVAAGGVQVRKNDLELGKSEALGGNSHDAKDMGSTLSGIEFTIVNASEHGVMVNGRWFHVGDEVMKVYTHWNEEAEAYTAETADDALPYGTYTIQETATNDSYLLTDGKARTFEVREDGHVVTASKDGDLVFANQVVRNDLEIAKKADSDNRSLMVPFAIENVATGEKHVIVTDRNGNVSTASSWNKHSNNTNGNDKLLEMDGIKATDMDAKAGIWFSLGEDGGNAEVNDELAAMPYGEYRLTELRCDANAGLQLVEKTFWIERDSTVAKAAWLDIDDKDEPEKKIGTKATDGEDGDKNIASDIRAKIVDLVSYEGLNPGVEHTVSGTLMVKSTGESLKDASGTPVTASTTFTPEKADGAVEVVFEFDSSLIQGERIVVFESVRERGIEVAVHMDINDEGQTVDIEKPGVGTTATDADDGDHEAIADEKVEIIDEIAYHGLKPGVEYEVSGTLMDKQTGNELVDANGKAVTASAKFTTEKPDGTVEVRFEFDGSNLAGHDTVAFETVTHEGKEIVVHADIEDEGQTVKLVEPGEPGKEYPKTGAEVAAAAGVSTLVLGGCAIAGAAYAVRKRREDKAVAEDSDTEL